MEVPDWSTGCPSSSLGALPHSGCTPDN